MVGVGVGGRRKDEGGRLKDEMKRRGEERFWIGAQAFLPESGGWRFFFVSDLVLGIQCFELSQAEGKNEMRC